MIANRLFLILPVLLSFGSLTHLFAQAPPCKPYWDLASSGGNRSTSNKYILTSSIGQTASALIKQDTLQVLQGWHQNFFFCGDPDGSGFTTVSDVVYLIRYIFEGGSPPLPFGSGDVDCNGVVNISDAVYLILYIFSGGQVPCEHCPCGL